MKTVGESNWVSMLQQPHTRVTVDMSGVPFLYLPAPSWDTSVLKISAHLIYFVAKGSCRVVAGGREFTLNAGELCWVCPEEKFRFYAGNGKPPVLQRFRLVVMRGRQSLRLPWKAKVFPDTTGAMEWGRLLVEEERDSGRYVRRRVSALAALFSMAVFESKKKPERRQGLSDEIRRRISRHVLDRIGQRISPGDLARLAGLSPDYFVRRFKQSFGASPREWMLRQRLRQAAGALAETDERVSEIAARLGYPDGCLFSRQFKAEFGSSPHRWRRNHTMSELKV